jgi:hypothetical protein
MLRNQTIRTYTIAFPFDVTINGGAIGLIQFPNAPVIPPGAIWEETFFICTIPFVSSGGGTFDLETTALILINLNVLPVSTMQYQRHIDDNPIIPLPLSDGSSFFVQIYTAAFQFGAGLFIQRYSIFS